MQVEPKNLSRQAEENDSWLARLSRGMFVWVLVAVTIFGFLLGVFIREHGRFWEVQHVEEPR